MVLSVAKATIETGKIREGLRRLVQKLPAGAGVDTFVNLNVAAHWLTKSMEKVSAGLTDSDKVTAAERIRDAIEGSKLVRELRQLEAEENKILDRKATLMRMIEDEERGGTVVAEPTQEPTADPVTVPEPPAPPEPAPSIEDAARAFNAATVTDDGGEEGEDEPDPALLAEARAACRTWVRIERKANSKAYREWKKAPRATDDAWIKAYIEAKTADDEGEGEAAEGADAA